MAVIALTLPLARRSAVRVPRRDLVAGAGEPLVLRVRIAEADRHDAPLLDMRASFARVRMHVFRDASPLGGNHDYAFRRSAALLTTASAMADAADPAAAVIRVRGEETHGWLCGARLGWSLQAAARGQEVALCWGALHMRPGLGMPPLFVLTGDGEKTLTGDAEPVVL